MSPQASISISRAGQELGTWSAADIRKMLAAGVLVAGDQFWQEGMAEWSTLEHLVPPTPAVQSFPVAFGSALALDPLGFLGSGELRVDGDKVEFTGRRQWPGWARFVVFVVATPVGWWLLGTLTDAIPHDGGVLLHWLAVCLTLFTLVGTPLLVLTLMPFFCASATTLLVDRSAVTKVDRRGRGVALLVTLGTGKPRPCRFRAKSDSEAGHLVGLLQDEGAPSH